MSKFKPTVSQHFIKLLEDRGVREAQIFESIDNLASLAGDIGPRNYFVNGNNSGAVCSKTEKVVSREMFESCIKETKIYYSPDKAPVKPEIRFTGEDVPADFLEL